MFRLFFFTIYNHQSYLLYRHQDCASVCTQIKHDNNKKIVKSTFAQNCILHKNIFAHITHNADQQRLFKSLPDYPSLFTPES